jgi:hypothetical protein
MKRVIKMQKIKKQMNEKMNLLKILEYKHKIKIFNKEISKISTKFYKCR